MSASDRDALDCIEIPIPCKASWDAMFGDDRVRHCGDCRQDVYNIAAFSRREAMQLVQERSGRVCLRIFRRPDGTVITDDCRTRLRAARKRGLLIFAGTLVVVAWAQLIGLMSLRRVMSPSTTTAEPATVSAATAKPVPIVPPMATMGAPPPPREPEPRRKKPRRADARHHGKVEKPKPITSSTVELMGDVVDLS